MTNEEAKDVVGGILQAVETLNIEVNNKIDNFIVDQVNMITNQHHITVNAQMIAYACMKQIPKKPSESVFHEDSVTWCCPTCGRVHINEWKPKYCSECGQAIDWTEEGA